MTQLTKFYNDNDHDRLKELLIKNLPRKIKAGNEKAKANIFTMPTVRALESCKFINFNSSERISFMIFDFDTYKDKKATDTFKNIDTFFDYLYEKIALEPTYILKTDKGFHFAYHLKNHVYMKSKKSLEYLNNIKQGVINLIGCDIHGSSRNSGVWRNPLQHDFYFSQEYNYELKDFKDFAIYRKTPQQRFQREITIRQVDKEILKKGNRNNAIFYASMKWAKNKKNLSLTNIVDFALSFNDKADEPLKHTEISKIAKSVYRYYSQNKINIKNPINEGIMGFGRIDEDLDYETEVKRRQSLSAKRTNKILGKDRKKEIMLKAKKFFQEKRKNEFVRKINEAVKVLEAEGKRVTNKAISEFTGISRKTVGKYRE